MRQLQDCKAEVFRRSKERIEKRRRRNRIAALCLPLVLCVSIALYLPGGDNKGATEGIHDAAPESSREDTIHIQITGGDVSLSHTDPQVVQRILLQLDTYNGILTGGLLEDAEITPESIVADGSLGETQAPSDVLRGWDEYSSTYQSSAHAGYTIAVTQEDGSVLSYYLSGNTLENLTTDETYPLTQAELENLKELLGVS